MYTPKAFVFDDREEQIAFLRSYPFATIVTAVNTLPLATSLPFVIDDRDGVLRLKSHFALANKQSGYIQDYPSIVIFSGPYAYISPRYYDKEESVPTWDYIAVHAYGKVNLIEDDAARSNMLIQMINFFEPDYLKQWHGLSDKFKQGMMKGIVAFELEVTDLQGQKKLSQNKTAVERERMVRGLEKSQHFMEKELAFCIKNISL